MNLRVIAFGVFSFFATQLFAAEIPGGLIRTADSMATNTYELMLSPAYTFSPGGAYLNSEIRYQPTEEFGTGLAFGAGEVGFNFGAYGVVHILPDVGNQPGFSVLGGLYLNRVDRANYFVVRAVPTVSKTFRFSWGRFVPYSGVSFAPSFRLAEPLNTVAMKLSIGSEFIINDFSGLRLWTEAGVGLANSVHQVVMGLSYPFSALGE